jgi:hypothetical protein
MHAMRAEIYSTLGSSPRSLTFNRDMFLNIPLIADWHAITQRREHLINENVIRKNKKQRRYDYVPQQRVLKKKLKPCKLGETTSGPYRVLQTHVNGTLTIELRQGVSERINIRRVIPYREPDWDIRVLSWPRLNQMWGNCILINPKSHTVTCTLVDKTILMISRLRQSQ